MNNDPFAEGYDPNTAPKKEVITMCDDCKNFLSSDLMDKILQRLGDREIVCIVIHGSKLYGLDNSESDTDIKGVFLPSKRDYLLNNIPKTIKFSTGNDNSKNSKDDFDIEFYSINYFFFLASKGDTSAISMLNAPFNMICSQREMWMSMVKNASIFYSKSMDGLIGYVRTQASKYSIKGDRLGDAINALNFLEACDPDTKLTSLWSDLPTGDHIEKIQKIGQTVEKDQIFYSVCERKIQNTCDVRYAIGVVKSIVTSYGKRSMEAKKEGGLDWKAISHAFRVASELSDLYQFGMIRYPLPDFERIKKMKMGELDFESQVLPDLNSLMDRVHEMSALSSFPEEVNSEKIEDFLFELLDEKMKK